MASCRITTLRQRLSVLERISKRYVGWRFEHNELVNEMYLSRPVREAQCEHHLVRAGYNALYDYFRREFAKKRTAPAPLPGQRIMESGLRNVIFRLDFDDIMRGLTRVQKLILKLRSDWFTAHEIGKVAGTSRGSVRWQMGDLKIIEDRAKEWLET